MVVRTHTYTVRRFANPYLKCKECGVRAEGLRSDNGNNYPCNHTGIRDTCYSWSPVDGCTCEVPHG